MRFKKTMVSVLIVGTLSIATGIVWAQTYYVQPGDSLYQIAARFGTTVSALQQSNGLRSSSLYPGQALYVSPGSVPASGNSSSYTVRSGDSLFLLSQKYGVSVDSLKQANNLSSNYLTVGQKLVIPGSNNSSGSGYQVQTGDSVFLIARKYGVTVEALLKANNLSYGQSIFPGQRLVIPQGSSGGGSNSNYYNFNLSQQDLNLLARLVSAESDGESFQGQVAVASTILNRLRDPRYPKTIPEIVYQVDNGCYQYSPVLDGRINLPASSGSYRAVQSAISGWDPSNGANGFYNPDKTTSQWVRSHPVTAVIGNHVFFNY